MNAHRSGRYRARGALATTPLLPELSPTPAPTLPGRGHGFSLPSRQGASRRREGTPEPTTQGTSLGGALHPRRDTRRRALAVAEASERRCHGLVHTGAHRHPDVARPDLDLLSVRVEARAPVHDAVAAGVDREVADALRNRPGQLIPVAPAAVAGAAAVAEDARDAERAERAPGD